MATRRFATDSFRAAMVGDPSDIAALAQTRDDYVQMLGCVVAAMLQRYERRGDYHFIDTKLSLRTGEDFPADDPVRGPEVIYGWIQGRGLEALAGHEAWLRRCPDIDASLKDEVCGRLHRMMAEVFAKMEAIRQANGGRLFFTMTRTGQPLRMAADGRLVPHEIPADSPANTTELFYAKGMMAAAHALDDRAKAAEARQWFHDIDRDIREGRFARDQQPLDPGNVAVKPVEGRHGHGARMLGLGAAALMLECTGDPVYQDIGLAYLDHVIERHVNTGQQTPSGQIYDMWEFVDDAGNPWLDDSGAQISDPGHACECVGLALKLLAVCEAQGTLSGLEPDRLAAYRRILPGMLEQNFANGFSPAEIGIVKAYDLVARRPLRTDMPWWSLPETMRAALGAARVVDEDDRPRYVAIAAKCSNAFGSRFVRPDLHLMAYQTLDAAGQPIDTIPATPDADPGYHTGLSIIDYLDLLAGLAKGQ